MTNGEVLMTMNPGFSSQRHAYLILCHNNFKILQMLLSAIDDDRNDIYIHVDKKTVDIPFEDIRSAVCHSPLTYRTHVRELGWVLANKCRARTSIGGYKNTACLLSPDIWCGFPIEIAG